MKFIFLFLSFSVLQQFSWCWRMWRPRPSSKDRACWTWRWARGSTATTRRPRSGTGKWPNARPALRLRSEFVSAGCRCVTRTIDKHLTREIVSGCSTLSLCFLNASLKKCWNVRPRERGQDLLLFLLPMLLCSIRNGCFLAVHRLVAGQFSKRTDAGARDDRQIDCPAASRPAWVLPELRNI